MSICWIIYDINIYIRTCLKTLYLHAKQCYIFIFEVKLFNTY
nr:MAG TPA: hypothetical protein [Bacteriophage sp.]